MAKRKRTSSRRPTIRGPGIKAAAVFLGGPGGPRPKTPLVMFVSGPGKPVKLGRHLTGDRVDAAVLGIPGGPRPKKPLALFIGNASEIEAMLDRIRNS